MDLAIYTTKLFDRKMKKEDVTDVDLCQAASEVMNSCFEADLGGGVLKKRLALQSGKSGGARSIIFFKKGSHVFFSMVGEKTKSPGKAQKRSRKMCSTLTRISQQFFYSMMQR